MDANTNTDTKEADPGSPPNDEVNPSAASGGFAVTAKMVAQLVAWKKKANGNDATKKEEKTSEDAQASSESSRSA